MSAPRCEVRSWCVRPIPRPWCTAPLSSPHLYPKLPRARGAGRGITTAAASRAGCRQARTTKQLWGRSPTRAGPQRESHRWPDVTLHSRVPALRTRLCVQSREETLAPDHAVDLARTLTPQSLCDSLGRASGSAGALPTVVGSRRASQGDRCRGGVYGRQISSLNICATPLVYTGN